MNKDLLIDGEKYISASRAARKLGYAQDYVGELIRKGKVSGRMIGRTWYVDIEALRSHKRGRPQRAPELTESLNISSPVVVPKPPKILKSEPETLIYLPSLSKQRPRADYSIFIKNFSVSLTSVLIVILASYSWVSFLSPSTADKINIQIADASNSALALESNVSGAFHSAVSPIATRAKNFFTGLLSGVLPSNLPKLAKVQVAAAAEGVIVASESGSHSDAVQKIKNIFSDEVSVSQDPDGASGIITPVFAKGSSTDAYTFVLVPIKPKK